MLSQFIRTLKDLFANLPENSVLAYFDPTLSVIVSILTISAFLISGTKLCFRGFRILTAQKPIDRLYKAMIGHSVASKSEVIYQIHNYQEPDFFDGKTVHQLCHQIMECSGDKQSAAAVFSVIGCPACGKTTTMRYLYCQLSKKRKCIYFQMQDVISMKSLSRYLSQQKAANYFNDSSSVIAFFDGLDEAYAFFREENPNSMEDAFKSIFFSGMYSKINEVFQNNHLNLDCIVVSLRPEFLERSRKSLTELQYKSISSRVFQIRPMSNRDVIKIFKSLRVLKRIETKRDEEKKRHQKRYPPLWRTYHYTRMLRRILRENPDCLFHYPMYIRYAYAFMQEYEKRLADEERAFSSNISISFDILLEAIIKWEYHIYLENESGEINYEKFKQKMQEFAQAAVLALPKEGKQYLPKDKFESIIQYFFPGKLSRLAAAHCFMVSDDEGKCFSFCHRTFYEYFLAKYLFEKADYICRKERLDPENGSDNLRAMYYSILCRNEALNARISESYQRISNGALTLVSYQSLEKEGKMAIQNESKISLVEILEYLPCIKKFQYREKEFIRESLEDLIDCGTLDLHETGWDSLNYVEGITPLDRIKMLNIDELPLKDVSTLRKCSKLDYLHMQFSKEDDPLLEQILDQLRKMSLCGIYITSLNGGVCRQVYQRIRNGILCVKQVFVKVPNYSKVHLEMYRLNQELKQLDHSSRFYPSVRSALKEAENIFNSAHAKKDSKMLTAVFELEADESGMLGLEKEDSEATYWNGLSLIACYDYNDYTDEDNQAIRLCLRLKTHSAKNSLRFVSEFGLLYGKLLNFKGEYERSKTWLANSYYKGEEYLSEKKIVECGLYLYKSQIRSHEHEKDLDAFAQGLKAKIKKLKDYQTTWLYARFLEYNCARQLIFWEKGESVPENLTEMLICYQETADFRHESGRGNYHQFQSLYFNAFYANRSENRNWGRQTLKKMSQMINQYSEELDDDMRTKQACWIQYHEQRLYYALLADDRDIILNTAEKLLNYPYRKSSTATAICESIRQAYQETDRPNIDRHQLWDIVWF